MTIEKMMSDSTFKEKYVLEKLIMHFLGLSREDLWLKSGEEIASDDIEKIKEAYKRFVVDKMPIEYVLGFVEFFGNKFMVNENTLVPRPETEYMILAVGEYVERITPPTPSKIEGTFPGIVLIDLGTGCGVLGTSVLMQNPGVFQKAYFTDISSGALEVARRNYERLVVKSDLTPNPSLMRRGEFQVEFLESDLLEFWDSGKFVGISEDLNKVGNIVIVANLPYIPDEMFDENAPDNVKNYEPRFAFVGGEDGLNLYRRMFEQILDSRRFDLIPEDFDNKRQSSVILENLQSSIVMFLEMMTRQVDILRKEFPWIEFEEVKTFHFNIRIVKASLKKI